MTAADPPRLVVRPGEVLARLGVSSTSVRPLGAGANMHWLVSAGGERIVLRRNRPGQTMSEVAYELRVLERMAAAGWPVPTAVAPPVQAGGCVWCVFRYLPGRRPSPRTPQGVGSEQRARGRLLARLHADLAGLVDQGQRQGWLRREQVLGERSDGPPLEKLLNDYARRGGRADEARILRWHADRARERFSELGAETLPVIVLHGDFAPWNLRYRGGRLSGVLDFDFTHLDHRVADFGNAWRGHHDEVVHGYAEVAPLEPVEQELMTPAWWAWVLDYARLLLLRAGGGEPDRGEFRWVMSHIVRRSPLTRE